MMPLPVPVSIACLLVFATPALAQKMGHSNTFAPEITQVLKLGDRGTLKLTYTSITWSGGTWAKALQDEKTRDSMRERINAVAASDPLGSFETDKVLKIGGARVPAGRYKLAFMLNERFAWQVVLTGAKTIPLDLEFVDTKRSRKRLTLNLDAGDKNFTARLRIAFGARESELEIALRAAARTYPGILNSQCPLMEEEIDPEVTLTYGGHKIGLCCKDCVEDWNELTKKARDGHLAKMRAAAEKSKRSKDPKQPE